MSEIQWQWLRNFSVCTEESSESAFPTVHEITSSDHLHKANLIPFLQTFEAKSNVSPAQIPGPRWESVVRG